MLTLYHIRTHSIVLDQVEDNIQTKEVVRLASAEGPEVRFCCLSFQRRFLKDSPLLVPADEDRMEVELHSLSPSPQVHSLNLSILCFNCTHYLLFWDLQIVEVEPQIVHDNEQDETNVRLYCCLFFAILMSAIPFSGLMRETRANCSRKVREI